MVTKEAKERVEKAKTEVLRHLHDTKKYAADS